MMDIAWVSVSITLAIFVISHIVITVWWASKVNTLLDVVQIELKELIHEFKATRAMYVSKEELAARIALSDKEHQAMWKRIDSMKQ